LGFKENFLRFSVVSHHLVQHVPRIYLLCHSLQDFRIAFKVLGVLRNVLEC
jgi:hypothetical protein